MKIYVFNERGRAEVDLPFSALLKSVGVKDLEAVLNEIIRLDEGDILIYGKDFPIIKKVHATWCMPPYTERLSVLGYYTHEAWKPSGNNLYYRTYFTAKSGFVIQKEPSKKIIVADDIINSFIYTRGHKAYLSGDVEKSSSIPLPGVYNYISGDAIYYTDRNGKVYIKNKNHTLPLKITLAPAENSLTVPPINIMRALHLLEDLAGLENIAEFIEEV